MSHFIVSWYGNKRQEIQHFKKYYPPKDSFNIVIEPFAGSGAVSFDLNMKTHMNDIDPELISIYAIIKKNDLNTLFKKSFDYVNELNKKGKSNREIIQNLMKNDNKIIPLIAKFQYKRLLSYYKTFDRIKQRQPTKKQIEFQQFMKDMVTITNDDYKKIYKKYCNNPKAFLFIAPPYLDSSNSEYYSKKMDLVGADAVINDNTRIFIDTLELLRDCKCKVMLVINDNELNRYIYQGFIKDSYIKQYSNTLFIKNRAYKRRTKHLIITNY